MEPQRKKKKKLTAFQYSNIIQMRMILGKRDRIMLNITVCDDNKDELDSLCAMIESVLREQAVDGKINGFTDSGELMNYLHRSKADESIAFLDIQLQDESGIQVAKLINQEFPQICVIFVSGHISYAQEIFDARPIYFLLKPVAADKLKAALSLAAHEKEAKKEESVPICSKGHVFRLRLNYIRYISSDRRVATKAISSIWTASAALIGKAFSFTRMRLFRYRRNGTPWRNRLF
jgi:FixJ family two-component response regulator